MLFFENSTAALILDKRKSCAASLRGVAVVVLGGFAQTSPHEDANSTGSRKKKDVMRSQGEKKKTENIEHRTRRVGHVEEGLTIWLLPINGGTSIWGGGREYNLAPYAVPLRWRRRGVIDGLQY